MSPATRFSTHHTLDHVITDLSPLPRHDLTATAAERRAAGRVARSRAPRKGFGTWSEGNRGHDALTTILAQNAIGDPTLVPLRHERMAVSPWDYYRGAAAFMAADLGSCPHSAIEVQLCGDAHVLKFGLWATPERNLSFDLRDFDESLPGPCERDLQRLAASLIVAGQASGIRPGRSRSAVEAAVAAQRDRMHKYARMPELEISYDGIHVDGLLGYFEPADRGGVAVHIEKKKRHRTHEGAHNRLTEMARGRPRITEEPPIRTTVDDDEQLDLVDELLAGYRQTLQGDRRHLFDRSTETDVVRQVIGVGSVGMRVYLVLLEGRSGCDPLFLQCKQAGPSVYEASTRPSIHDNHGASVVEGERLVQSATDIFVGWTSFRGHDYYVRQFRDMKIIPTIQLIAPRLIEFATACGGGLAWAHARTGDPVAIDAYLASSRGFTDAIVAFTGCYADQNARDHAQLVDVLASGSTEAEPD